MFLLGIGSGFTASPFGALWPEVYGLANLGGIRAIIVSAMVLSSALGPGVSGALIGDGIPLPKQWLWLSVWCVAGCFVLGFAARQVRPRESRVLIRQAALQRRPPHCPRTASARAMSARKRATPRPSSAMYSSAT